MCSETAGRDDEESVLDPGPGEDLRGVGRRVVLGGVDEDGWPELAARPPPARGDRSSRLVEPRPRGDQHRRTLDAQQRNDSRRPTMTASTPGPRDGVQIRRRRRRSGLRGRLGHWRDGPGVGQREADDTGQARDAAGRTKRQPMEGYG